MYKPSVPGTAESSGVGLARIMPRSGYEGKIPGVHHGEWLLLLFTPLPYWMIQTRNKAALRARF